MIEQTPHLEGYMECHLCAVEDKTRARRCVHCSGQLSLREKMYLEIKKRRRRRMAPYLSVLVPGLGHWYAGRRYVGTYFLAMAPLCLGLVLATYQKWNWGLSSLSLGIILIWAMAIIDSRKRPHHFTPPCQDACPGNVPCSYYVHMAANGMDRESLEAIEAVCPFPGTIGRICHHPCETFCNRGKDGEPVAICTLKRFVDDATDRPYNFYRREIDRHTETVGHRIAVVGAGPSGLSAAVFLRILGFDVSLYDARDFGGGTPLIFAPGYRLPQEVYQKEVQRILDLDLDLNFGKTFGKDFTLKDLQDKGCSGIYLALGAMRSVSLPHTGEESEGFLDGREFLEDVVLGDGVQLPGQVLVIGGGNVAMDVARSAVRSGADKVKIICLEKKHVPKEKRFHHFKNEWTEIKTDDTGEFMPAWQWEVDDAVNENVEIIDAGATVSFDIEDSRVVRARCQKVERIDVDPQGRLIPVLQDGSDFTVEADWVITAVGSSPDYSSMGGRPEMTELSKDIPLSLMASGKGVSVPVLSGGDFVNGPASVIDGIAAGREAACYLYSELLGDPPINIRYQKRLVYQPWANYPDSLDKRQKRKQDTDPYPGSNGPFSEVFLGFRGDVARDEADRCMRCDWPLVRESKVKRFLRSTRKS